MEQDKMHGEFEAAYRKARSEHGDGYDLRRIGDIYKCEHAQFAWDIWHAAIHAAGIRTK
ncbi:hypothetical protein [Azorhizophilus paspali]|uniref:Uncharacterized protein n=1 Tax=Azorhizophilus paspali TaxID=69963 RepID=A0ABV6SRU0_AZOPA